MTLPLTGDLGNREKYKYTWVHSVQPPQPYIILEGGGETAEEEPLEIYRVYLLDFNICPPDLPEILYSV